MEPLIVFTDLLIDFLTDIHGRVGRHPSVFERMGIEIIALPPAYNLTFPAILQISIDHIDRWVLERIGDLFDGMGRKEHIVRVQETDMFKAL